MISFVDVFKDIPSPPKGERVRVREPFNARGCEGEIAMFCVRGLFHRAHQFFVTRTPISFGSVRNMLVVKPLSSLFRKSPVMAVVLNTFLS
jgi:hypothetical protein